MGAGVMSDETAPLIAGGGGPRQLGRSSENRGADEQERAYRKRWRSIRIMYLTMFLSSVAFSICMSSIYPFLQRLDPTTTPSTVGWVIASYSLGQFIASPCLGFWANRRHSSREPLVLSMLIFVVANVLYAYLQDFASGLRVPMVIAARTVIGFGAGNVAVARSYVAGATTLVERTGAMANIAGAQALGFMLGPAFQAAFSPLDYPGPVHELWLQLNVYTAPGLLSAVLGIVNVLLVVLVLREIHVNTYDGSINSNEAINDAEADSVRQVVSSSIASSKEVGGDDVSDMQPQIKPDMVAAIACIFVFFIELFMFSLYETIVTPMSLHMFDWTNEQTTFYVGLIMLGSGLVSIGSFTLVKYLAVRFDERRLVIAALGICIVGYIGFLPWGNKYPDIRPEAISPMNASSGQPFNGTTMEPVGCPAEYSWCYHTPKIYLTQLIACIMFISIGYPGSNVLTYSIFSKVLGPKPQGIMMGWLTAAGSMARMLGPIFVTIVYEAYGPRGTILLIIGIVLCGVIVVIMLYRRLVPYHLHVETVRRQRHQP